ncbi:hypothetical protein P8631_06255 [Guyparkeria sp. 1SP6A2]|nr:hypothetical protein [Guyparkeria sp. 1SP6A2]
MVGYWDFPVSTSLPIIRREAVLGGAPLESVLKYERCLDRLPLVFAE